MSARFCPARFCYCTLLSARFCLARFCYGAFWNFFTIYVFEVSESFDDIPTELPCFGDLKNSGHFLVQEVFKVTQTFVLWQKSSKFKSSRAKVAGRSHDQRFIVNFIVMSRKVISCHVMPRYATSCHVMLRHATSCHVMLRHVISRHVMSCHVVPHHVQARSQDFVTGVHSSQILHPSPIQLGGLGQRCKLPQRGLGRSPSRQRFWCILDRNGSIWCYIKTIFAKIFDYSKLHFSC